MIFYNKAVMLTFNAYFIEKYVTLTLQNFIT